MTNELEYKIIKPDPKLSDFVERFWTISNHTDNDKEIVAIPDGRIDIFFTYSDTEKYSVFLLGIETEPSKHIFSAQTVIFGISLKLLAVEYLLNTSISKLLNDIQFLPIDFWDISEADLINFDSFCIKISDKLKELIKPNLDEKKRELFKLIYSSDGSLTVKELSEKVFWNSRQINRYFNQKFGISLKAYCNILRFKASFTQIKNGELYPEQNFSDQAHFTREVKKLSGVVPKELSKNKNDRFIQFFTLLKK